MILVVFIFVAVSKYCFSAYWLRSNCSICSRIFGTVMFVSSISSTVYIYCIAKELTPNSKVARILPPSLRFPIGGEVGIVHQTQQSCTRVWLLDFMAVLFLG